MSRTGKGKSLLFIFLIHQLKELIFTRKMIPLTSLIGKIAIKLPKEKRIPGVIKFLGEKGDRYNGEVNTLNFSYKILGKEAEGFCKKYPEDKESWAERGLETLIYHFGENNPPEANIIKKENDKANIEILYVPRKIEKSLENKAKVKKPDKIEKIRDIENFAKTIYSSATFLGRKKKAIFEVRGEIDETWYPPKFVAILASGIKYDGIKNMEDYKQFSKICESLKDTKYDKSEEVIRRLVLLKKEILKSPENPRYYFSKRAKRETPEITLDKEKKVLTILPFR